MGGDIMNEKVDRLKAAIEQRIVGKSDVIDKLIAAFLAEGHVLLEDVPGVGKTSLAKALADSVALSFARIQCTPDTMPSDITGVSIFNSKDQSFQVMPGPVVSNIVLVDELNRTSPKTQSALLQVMEEQQVTIDGNDIPVPSPFMVIGTQNPVEMAGTYPLPEAQLDRFAMKLLVEYPTKEELAAIVNLTEGFGAQPARPIINPQTLIEIRQMIQQVPIAEPVMDRALTLVMSTHEENKYIREGASPRAAQYIVRCAKARAFMQGRLNVAFEDVDYVAPAVLRHRIILSFDAVADNVSAGDIIKEMINQ
jgi:MoxR-like ATPase